jgi:hypothetical protein
MRIHLTERILIERAAAAAGQSVTEWARDILLARAAVIKEPEMTPKQQPPPPRRLQSGVFLKSIEPEPPPRKGLELDEETALLLSGGRPPPGSV